MLVDSGADSIILNLDRLPSTHTIDRSHPVELRLSGAVSSASSTAWVLPKLQVCIAGVEKTLTGVIATSMPALEFGLVIGKPCLAETDCHVDHHQSAVFFPDGGVWCQDPEHKPSPTWKPAGAARKSPVEQAINRAAADRLARHGLGSLFTIRVDVSQVKEHPAPLTAKQTAVINALVTDASAAGGDELTPAQQQQANEIRDEFADISSNGKLPHFNTHARKVGEHPIELDEGAVKSFKHRPPPRMSEQALAELRRQLKYLIEHGFIRPSRSPIASLAFFVPKKGGALRMVVDYRELNRHTVKDRPPNPDLSHAVDKAAGHQFYTTIDLVKGPCHTHTCNTCATILQHQRMPPHAGRCGGNNLSKRERKTARATDMPPHAQSKPTIAGHHAVQYKSR